MNTNFSTIQSVSIIWQNGIVNTFSLNFRSRQSSKPLTKSLHCTRNACESNRTCPVDFCRFNSGTDKTNKKYGLKCKSGKRVYLFVIHFHISEQHFTFNNNVCHLYSRFTDLIFSQNRLIGAYLSVGYQKSVDRRQLDSTAFTPVVVIWLREKQLPFHCEP